MSDLNTIAPEFTVNLPPEIGEQRFVLQLPGLSYAQHMQRQKRLSAPFMRLHSWRRWFGIGLLAALVALQIVVPAWTRMSVEVFLPSQPDGQWWSWSGGDVALLSLLVFVAGMLALFVVFYTTSGTGMRAIYAASGAGRSALLRVGEQGVQIVVPGCYSVVLWQRVDELQQVAQMSYLLINGRTQALAIAHSAFANDAQRDEFTAFIRQKLAQRK